jgi:phosphatidylinositol 3-kinase
LTKFLKCVVWHDKEEVKEAVELLDLWVDIDIDDSLELLSSAFRHPRIRNYAVHQLKKADNQELQLYLLQLVQALRYEYSNVEIPATTSVATPIQSIHTPTSGIISLDPHDSNLVQFLLDRACQNASLCTYLYWYLNVESTDKFTGQWFSSISSTFINHMLDVKDLFQSYSSLKKDRYHVKWLENK